jgi:hypothetical protein
VQPRLAPRFSTRIWRRDSLLQLYTMHHSEVTSVHATSDANNLPHQKPMTRLPSTNFTTFSIWSSQCISTIDRGKLIFRKELHWGNWQAFSLSLAAHELLSQETLLFTGMQCLHRLRGRIMVILIEPQHPLQDLALEGESLHKGPRTYLCVQWGVSDFLMALEYYEP